LFTQNKMKKINNQKAFTLIEILMVLGLFALLSAATFSVYGGLRIFSGINETVPEVVQTLRLARDYSRAGNGGAAYGVHFEINPSGDDSFTLYKGGSYAQREAVFDRVYYPSKLLELSTTLKDDEINFSKISGIPDNSGTISFLSNDNESKTVVINDLGFVSAD
jgi:prepilin-type N-terminal cleavage/methylation domain-containing protein